MAKIRSFRHVDLEFNRLSCSLPTANKELKPILKSLHGSFRHGHLIAIVGPSGAGKTTLLDILAGFRTEHISGSITVNGGERRLRSFRKQCSYIMQEHDLLQYLSVHEYMQAATSLKLPNNPTEAEKEFLIADILQKLGLSHCSKTRVSDLSGGEKKRLSIALELVNNPPLMLMDEPTSGLDSSHSFKCIQLLSSLAREGRTIICTVHQPSARLFDMFDHLYAIADGQCIYQGKPLDVIPFLQTVGLNCPSYHNPLDFLVEVAFGEHGSYVDQLSENVKNEQFSSYKCRKLVKYSQLDVENANATSEMIYLGVDEVDEKHVDVQIDTTKNGLLTPEFIVHNDHEEEEIFEATVPFWTQFTVLLWRSSLETVRSRVLTQVRFLLHIVVALSVGLLFFQVGNEASLLLTNLGGIFFGIMFMVCVSMVPPTMSFPLERNVFVREHQNHWYSLNAYYLSKTLADVPFQILCPTAYMLIVYFMTNQPMEAFRFFMVMYFAIMSSLLCQSIGLVVGVALKAQMAMFFGLAFAVPPFLFSGFLIAYSAIPGYLRWISYLSYIRYATEGIYVSLYGLNRTNLHCSEAFCVFKNPEKVLELVDMREENLVLDAVMLIVYFVLVRILGYIILRRKFKTKAQ